DLTHQDVGIFSFSQQVKVPFDQIPNADYGHFFMVIAEIDGARLIDMIEEHQRMSAIQIERCRIRVIGEGLFCASTRLLKFPFKQELSCESADPAGHQIELRLRLSVAGVA